MKVLKVKSSKTYTSKSGSECHYYNYYLILDNNSSIQIKCAYQDGYAKLDAIAEYKKD